MPTDIVPTSTNGAATNRLPRFNGEQLTITIDNDNFTDAKDFLIEKRNISELGIQLQNVGSSNGMSFEIYGNIDSSATAPAFALIGAGSRLAELGGCAWFWSLAVLLTMPLYFPGERMQASSGGLELLASPIGDTGREQVLAFGNTLVGRDGLGFNCPESLL